MKNLLNFKTPDFLLTADKPLQLGGSITKIHTQEIESKFSFTYLENIVITNHSFAHRFGHNVSDTQRWEDVKKRLNEPLNDKLVVCFIDEQVGYGVFANELIPNGTIIGIYAGEIEKNEARTDYGMGITDTPFRINAEKKGGITRFIQHMPGDIRLFGLQPEETEEMQENELLQKIPDLATANIRSFILIIDDKPVLFLETCRNILKGQQLGISYGQDYWVKKQTIPCYFDKSGALVPKSQYIPALNSLLQEYMSEESTDLIQINNALRDAVFAGFPFNMEILLLEYGASINGQADDEKLWTPLHLGLFGYVEAVRENDLARQEKCRKCIELLVKLNANHNLQDIHGRSVTHYAAIHDLQWLIYLLNDNSIEVTVKDINGKKPFDYNISSAEITYKNHFAGLRSDLLTAYQYIKAHRNKKSHWIEGEVETIKGFYVDDATSNIVLILFGLKNQKRAISLMYYNEQTDLTIIKNEVTTFDIFQTFIIYSPEAFKSRLAILRTSLEQSNVKYTIAIPETKLSIVDYHYNEGSFRPRVGNLKPSELNSFFGEFIEPQKNSKTLNSSIITTPVADEVTCFWCIDTKNPSLSIEFDKLPLTLTILNGATEKYPQKTKNLFNTRNEAEMYLESKFKEKSAKNGGIRKAFILEINLPISEFVSLFAQRSFDTVSQQVSCIDQYSRDEKGTCKLASSELRPDPDSPQTEKKEVT